MKTIFIVFLTIYLTSVFFISVENALKVKEDDSYAVASGLFNVAAIAIGIILFWLAT
jgi:hypothetical protein